MGTSTCCGALVSITAPGGATVGAVTFVGTSGGFMDTRSLPADGVYTIVITPQNQVTGSMTLALYDVPADASADVTPGGAPVTVTTTVPGQNAVATFSGVAGARVSLRLAGSSLGSSTCCAALVTLRDPTGKALTPSSYVGTTGSFIDATTLPSTGTYTIAVDPQGAVTGSLTLTVYAVPPDATATATPGGAGVAIANSVPGQNMRLTFLGTAGQRISLKASASNLSYVFMSIQRPDGATLGSQAVFGLNGTYVDTVVLPGSGTYSILLDPQAAITGGATINIYDVPPDAIATITGIEQRQTSVATETPISSTPIRYRNWNA